MHENWDFLISEFRRLGGITDNVIQKEGEYGRIIFSIDKVCHLEFLRHQNYWSRKMIFVLKVIDYGLKKIRNII